MFWKFHSPRTSESIVYGGACSPNTHTRVLLFKRQFSKYWKSLTISNRGLPLTETQDEGNNLQGSTLIILNILSCISSPCQQGIVFPLPVLILGIRDNRLYGIPGSNIYE